MHIFYSFYYFDFFEVLEFYVITRGKVFGGIESKRRRSERKTGESVPVLFGNDQTKFAGAWGMTGVKDCIACIQECLI